MTLPKMEDTTSECLKLPNFLVFKNGFDSKYDCPVCLGSETQIGTCAHIKSEPEMPCHNLSYNASAPVLQNSYSDPSTLFDRTALGILAAACYKAYVSEGKEHNSEDVDFEMASITNYKELSFPSRENGMDILDPTSCLDVASSPSGTQFEDEDGSVEESIHDGRGVLSNPSSSYKNDVQANITANDRIEKFKLERLHKFQQEHVHEVIAKVLPMLSQLYDRIWPAGLAQKEELPIHERFIEEKLVTEGYMTQLQQLIEQEIQYQAKLFDFGIQVSKSRISLKV